MILSARINLDRLEQLPTMAPLAWTILTEKLFQVAQTTNSKVEVSEIKITSKL